MSYSQFGEDDIVAGIFGDYVGDLLEIGAWGVKEFSNSRLLIERGWNAVLVEFSPMPVHSLVKEYGHNERVKILQTAITVREEPVIEFDITENALSTANQDLKKRWADAGVDYYGKIWVPTLSITRLFNLFFRYHFEAGTFHKPDYVSIDTEGTSVDLALALLDARCRPRVLIVEYDDGPGLERLELRASMTDYRIVHKNDTNVILESNL